jgi:hypothetical protein
MRSMTGRVVAASGAGLCSMHSATAYQCPLSPDDCGTVKTERALRNRYVETRQTELSTLSTQALSLHIIIKSRDWVIHRADILPGDIAKERLILNICNAFTRVPSLVVSHKELREKVLEPSLALYRSHSGSPTAPSHPAAIHPILVARLEPKP